MMRVTSFKLWIWSLWWQRHRLYTLFSLSNLMLHLHIRWKRIIDADESTFRAREPVDCKIFGLRPGQIWILLTQAYGFSKEVMPYLPLTPIWIIRNFHFRRNGHKRQNFLPYFSVQICEPTRLCYRLSFEKLITNYTKKKSRNVENLV